MTTTPDITAHSDLAATDGGWRAADGTPISCREKLKVLRENEAELAQILQDAFEDAVLIGVDETAMRARLRAMIDALRSPRRSAAG